MCTTGLNIVAGDVLAAEMRPERPERYVGRISFRHIGFQVGGKIPVAGTVGMMGVHEDEETTRITGNRLLNVHWPAVV